MSRCVIRLHPWTLILVLALCAPLAAQTWSFQSMTGVTPINLKADLAQYRGHAAIHLVNDANAPRTQTASGHALALLADSDFEDGTIEAELAAAPRSGAFEAARGFAGIAFRIQSPDSTRFECFYLRPTNARADDQLRRNHTVQYIAIPDFDWQRLRQETPGVYESYADMEPAVWTSMKIVVSGTRARLYVNGAAQACLLVNDLKLGKSHGKVALWIGPDTEAYFSDVKLAKGQ